MGEINPLMIHIYIYIYTCIRYVLVYIQGCIQIYIYTYGCLFIYRWIYMISVNMFIYFYRICIYIYSYSFTVYIYISIYRRYIYICISLSKPHINGNILLVVKLLTLSKNRPPWQHYRYRAEETSWWSTGILLMEEILPTT